MRGGFLGVLSFYYIMEIWKSVLNEKNVYVSNYGNVKLCERSYLNINGEKRIYKEKICKQSLTGKGYKNGKGYFAVKVNNKLLKVHRLVASAFLINKNNYTQVNHIDGNSLNNNVENLEWCNNLQNQHHSKRDRSKFTSKFIGVRFRKDRLNYSAELKFKGKRYMKSGFLTENEANEYLTNLKKQLCL